MAYGTMLKVCSLGFSFEIAMNTKRYSEILKIEKQGWHAWLIYRLRHRVLLFISTDESIISKKSISSEECTRSFSYHMRVFLAFAFLTTVSISDESFEVILTSLLLIDISVLFSEWFYVICFYHRETDLELSNSLW